MNMTLFMHHPPQFLLLAYLKHLYLLLAAAILSVLLLYTISTAVKAEQVITSHVPY